MQVGRDLNRMQVRVRALNAFIVGQACLLVCDGLSEWRDSQRNNEMLLRTLNVYCLQCDWMWHFSTKRSHSTSWKRALTSGFLRLFDMGWTGRSDVLIKWLQWCTPCRSIFCCISSFLALDDFSTSTWHRPNAFAQQDSLGIRFSQPAGVMGPGGLWISRIQSTWGHWKIETFQQIAEGPQDSGQNESFFLLHWLWKLACASWSCLL